MLFLFDSVHVANYVDDNIPRLLDKDAYEIE